MLILAERLAEPLHEMLSMKIAGGDFFEACANCEKNKNKRDRKLSFLLAGDWGNAPKIKESSETRNKLKCKF